VGVPEGEALSLGINEGALEGVPVGTAVVGIMLGFPLATVGASVVGATEGLMDG